MTEVEWEIEQKRFDEGKTAHALDSKPAEINIVTSPFWEAFWFLHRTRGFDFNGNPMALPISEMKAWLDLFPDYDIKEFIELISAMDTTYLNFMSEKIEKQKEQNKAKK